MINDINSVTWDDGCGAAEGPLHRLPKPSFPLALGTNVGGASV